MKFSCSACGTSLKVRDDLAGKAVKCPKCGARNTVPTPEEAPPETAAGGGEAGADNPLAALAAMTGAAGAPRHPAAAEHGHLRAKPAAAGAPSPEPEQGYEEEASPGEPMPHMAHAAPSAGAGRAAERGVGALGYRGGEAGPPDAPRYQIVRVVGVIQQVLGYVIMAVGVLAILFGVVMAVMLLVKTKEPMLAATSMGGTTLVGLYLVIAGIFFVGAGQLLFCVRDMARNSFYLKRLG